MRTTSVYAALVVGSATSTVLDQEISITGTLEMKSSFPGDETVTKMYDTIEHEQAT